MTTVALARELFSNIREFTHDVLDGLPDEALTWRPDPDGNTIAWLVWHLARVQDDHVAGLADGEQ
ncbi:MAG: DinB family protein, partial [Ilumatobacter fluminis]